MRVAKWDNAKFFLIFLVVFGHLAAEVDTTSAFLNGFCYFVYLFHMPAFLFLAGLFSKKTVQERRFEKALSYLVLYLFMSSVRFLVVNYWLELGTKFRIFKEGGAPWFALALFFFYAITMLIRDWKPAYAMTVFVFLGIMAGYDNSLGDHMAEMRVITFYPFFLAGYYMNVDRLQKITQTLWVKIVSVAVLLGTLWISFADIEKPVIDFLKCRYSYMEVGVWENGGLYRAEYYLFAMLLIICVLALVPSGESFISGWGSRSIQVFALHIPLIKILVEKCGLISICKKIWPSHYALLFPVVALLITIVLSLKIWEPFFKILMNPTKGGNKKK